METSAPSIGWAGGAANARLREETPLLSPSERGFFYKRGVRELPWAALIVMVLQIEAS